MYLYGADEEMASNTIDFSNIQKGLTTQQKLERIAALFEENSKY